MRQAPRPADEPHSRRALDLDEQLDFQRRVWRFERAGWIVMALVLAAGLAGVFGEGPLSHATAAAGGVRVQYDRFAHYDSRTVLRISLERAVTAGDRVQVTLPHTYLKAFHVEQVLPSPETVIGRPDGLAFVFRAGGPTVLTFSMKPVERGLAAGSVDVAGAGPPLSFRQFIYP